MRIGMLHVDLPPHSTGGVARQVDLLAETLVARGHEVTVWSTTAGRSDASFEVCKVSASGGRLARVYGVASAFSRTAFAPDLDILHAHGDDWLLNTPIPLVRTFYGSALREALSATSSKRRLGQAFAYATEWISAHKADECATISASTRRQLPQVRKVVPCAVAEQFFNRPRTADEGRPTALFIAGTLGGRKRGHLVLEAVRLAKRRHPKLRLTVVCPENPNLSFVDWRPHLSTEELANLAAESTVLLSASSYEGFGVPYAEALAAGLPIATTGNPGARDILDQGRFGVVVRPEDLGQCLSDLLEDPGRRQHLSEAGRIRALLFAPHRVAEAYEGLYAAVRAGVNQS